MSTRDELVGLLVVGVSRCRILDADYRSFLDLVARHIGTALADAGAYHPEDLLRLVTELVGHAGVETADLAR